jgi:hypothetical protein
VFYLVSLNLLAISSDFRVWNGFPRTELQFVTLRLWEIRVQTTTAVQEQVSISKRGQGSTYRGRTVEHICMNIRFSESCNVESLLFSTLTQNSAVCCSLCACVVDT